MINAILCFIGRHPKLAWFTRACCVTLMTLAIILALELIAIAFG